MYLLRASDGKTFGRLRNVNYEMPSCWHSVRPPPSRPHPPADGAAVT